LRNVLLLSDWSKSPKFPPGCSFGKCVASGDANAETPGSVRRGFMELLRAVRRIGGMHASWSKSLVLIAAVWVAVAMPSEMLAQNSAVPGSVVAPMVGADGKPLAFAAASVRRNVSGTESCDADHLYLTGDAFRMTRCPLIVALFMAYVPADGAFMGFSTDGRVVGVPDWMKSELYDIDARVDEADMAVWKDPAKQKEMMHAMLQLLLKDRCKLAVHREMPERPVYVLVVGKNGPKFQEAKSVESAAILKEHPNAGAAPGGWGMFSMGANGSMDFYATPISSLLWCCRTKRGAWWWIRPD
jgi:uncharacterized protein (TIGR03435 family)